MIHRASTESSETLVSGMGRPKLSAKRRLPRVRQRREPGLRQAGKVEGHCYLVAVEVLVAVDAVAPDFHGKRGARDLAKAALQKESRSEGEGEDGLQAMPRRFAHQPLGERPAETVGLLGAIHTERSDFGDLIAIKLQGAATEHLALDLRHGKFPDVFVELPQSAGEHDALRSVVVDQPEDGGNVSKLSFSDGQ